MRRIKITEEQANSIKEMEESDALGGNDFLSASNHIERSFKKADTGEDLNEGPIVEMTKFGQEVLAVVLQFYQDPSTNELSDFWVQLGMDAGEVRELLTGTGLMAFATAKAGEYLSKKEILPMLKKFYNKLMGKVDEKKAVKQKRQAVNTFRNESGVHIEGEYDMEETDASSSGQIVGNSGLGDTQYDEKHLPSEEIYGLDELTAGSGSVGAYDVPMGDGGSFWTKGNDMAKTITKEQLEENAKTDTQYPKGSFVEMPACTKFDNNKVAQNGGCNQGAPANVKYKGSKNSVISDETLYTEIAKKTGKTVNEVETIIKGYNNK